MADISDVEQAVVNTVTTILYPAGSSQPSIIGAICRVYRGWPNPGTLNSDLTAAIVNVTVVTDSASGRTTTRYLPEWQMTSQQAGTTASVNGQTITVSGNPAVGDVVGALIDGAAYAYRVQFGDTAGLVAANIALVIQTRRPALAQGLDVLVASSSSIVMRVVCDSTTSFESRRQEKDLRIIFWCPSPPIRDIVASATDLAIDQISFLGLPDNSHTRIVYRNTTSHDQSQNALLYRRDLVYNIEYPTVLKSEDPSMLFGASDVNGNITYG